VVVEDAQSGVEAGRRGAFGLVLGVDRGTGAQTLLDFGADLVVDDLGTLVEALDRTRASSAPNPAQATPGTPSTNTSSTTGTTEEQS
jgi:hypothetical protein